MIDNHYKILIIHFLAIILLFSCAPEKHGNIGLTGIEFSCGDQLIEVGEICDGTDLDGKSCFDFEVPGREGFKFYRGDLACTPDCLSFDLSGCEGYCGDGVKDDAESCDQSDLNEFTCSDFPVKDFDGQYYYRGELKCMDDCTDFITSDCSGYCGDGTADDDAFNVAETCDNEDLRNVTCQTVDPEIYYYTGIPTCSSDCSDTLQGSCSGFCGDSKVNSDFDEQCDGYNINKTTCLDQTGHDYYEGKPACDGLCKLTDGNCGGGYCGDSEIQSNYGEVCDRSAIGDATCLSVTGHDYHKGKPGCDGSCGLIKGGCSGGYCGDDTCQYPPENSSNCSGDCYCNNNGTCNQWEAPCNCDDCYCCGNGICEENKGEDCEKCESDCGECPVCGDGVCEGDENDSNCCEDCNPSLIVRIINISSDTVYFAKDCDICTNQGSCSNSRAVSPGQYADYTLQYGDCFNWGGWSEDAIFGYCYFLQPRRNENYPKICYAKHSECPQNSDVCIGCGEQDPYIMRVVGE